MQPRFRDRWPSLAAAALLAAASAAPLAAAEVYVPLLNPVANDGSNSQTQVWVANGGTATGTFVPLTLAENSDGTQRSNTPGSTAIGAGRTFQLTNLGQGGKYALLALDLATGVTADARIVSTTASGVQTTTHVPVISALNALAAGARGQLLGLDRNPDSGRLIDFGIVNVARAAAQCSITFRSADGVALAPAATITVPPVGLRHFHDALGLVGLGRVAAARADVTCNQAFYPYAALFQWPASQYLFITPAVAGAAVGTPSGPPPASGSSVVFQKEGLVHAATSSNPKGIVAVPVDRALNLRRIVIDWDVVPGPWNREKIPGNHGLLWLYRGKFRSNTVTNVNAFGPNKYTVKMNQNVDLPAGQTTASEGGLTFQQGTRYHLHYIYDAEHETITVEVSSGGQVMRKLTMNGTANDARLLIPASGMTCEFGHYYGQEGPEVASPGWSYYDLRIEMVPY